MTFVKRGPNTNPNKTQKNMLLSFIIRETISFIQLDNTVLTISSIRIKTANLPRVALDNHSVPD